MDKYRRVVDPKSTAEALPIADHIVRVNVSGKLVNYIGYAEKKLAEDGGGFVELVALGRAINRAVTVAEILRRNYCVHQVTELRSVSIRDRYEPLEEGLRTLEMKRTMSSISITLAKSADKVDSKAVGYSPPLDNPAPFSEDVIAEMDHERSNAKAEKEGVGRTQQPIKPKKNSGGRKGRNKAKGKKANSTTKSNEAIKAVDDAAKTNETVKTNEPMKSKEDTKRKEVSKTKNTPRAKSMNNGSKGKKQGTTNGGNPGINTNIDFNAILADDELKPEDY